MQPKAAEQAGAKSLLNVNAREWVPYQTHVHASSEPGASSRDADDDQDDELWELIESFKAPRGGWTTRSDASAESITLRTHFICAVPHTGGSILMLVDRNIDIGGRDKHSWRSSDKLLFYVTRSSPVFCDSASDAQNFSRQVEQAFLSEAWAKHKWGSQVCETKKCRFPKFDASGKALKGANGYPLQGKHRERTLLTWEGMQVAVQCVFCVKPGIYADRQKAEALHRLLASVSSFFLKTNAQDVVADLITDAVGGDESIREPADGSADQDVILQPDPETAQLYDRLRAPAENMSLNAMLRQIAASMDAGEGYHGAGHDAHGAIRKVLFAKNVGAMYQVNKELNRLEQEDNLMVQRALEQLKEANISLVYTDDDGKERNYEIPRGIHVVDTDKVIEVVTNCFNKRVKRGSECRRCYILEIMTLPAIPRAAADEDFEEGSYSQARRNYFRHLFDTECNLYSAGHFRAGLDRPLRALAFAGGLSHSIADIIRQASVGGSMCSKYVSKQILSGQAGRSHILNCCHVIGSVGEEEGEISWDNFNLKHAAGKGIGGKHGGYVHQDLTHIAFKRIVPPSVQPHKMYITEDDTTSCWRCEKDGKRPEEGSPGYVSDSQGGGLCDLCIRAGPPQVLDPDCLQSMKDCLGKFDVGDAPAIETGGILPPFFLASCQLGAFGEELKGIFAVSSAAGSIFATVDAVLDMYECNCRAWDDQATYDPVDVEGYTAGSRVIDLSARHSGTQIGLLGMYLLVNTHPILAPFFKNKRMFLLSDSKCFYAVRRWASAQNIDRSLLYKVIPDGLRGGQLLDTGLHVISKHSEWIFKRFDVLISLYWKALVKRGSGKFFLKPRLSTRLALLSATFMAYDKGMQDMLLRAFFEYPSDPTLQVLVNLHECHIPLLMAYHSVFKLGRSPDVEIRRKMFDLWLEKLLPLMVVHIWNIGSDNYGKVLILFWGDLLWWKRHDPSAFSCVRDNFSNALDGEFIELIHSWIVQNFPRQSRTQTDYESARKLFLQKDLLQGMKAGLQETLGCAPGDQDRASHNHERRQRDVSQVREVLKANIQAAAKDAEVRAMPGGKAQRMVPSKEAGDGKMAYESCVAGPISPEMLLNHVHGFSGQTKNTSQFVDKLAARTTAEVMSDLNSATLNEYCKKADTTIKTDIKAAEKHFAEVSKKKDIDEGVSQTMHRQAQPKAITKALRFSVVSRKRASEIVFDEENPEVKFVVKALVQLLPGGEKALSRARDLGQAQPGGGDEIEEALHPLLAGKELIIARMHYQKPGDASDGAAADSQHVEYAMASKFCDSWAAWESAEQDVWHNPVDDQEPVLATLEPSMLACGDFAITREDVSDVAEQGMLGRAMIRRLHQEIEEAVQAGTVRCMMLMLRGETGEAMALSSNLARMRDNQACDVIPQASNYALFTVIHACAQTLEALYSWVGAPAEREGDQGRIATPLVVSRLLDARDNIRKALKCTRIGARPGLIAEGPAGINLKAHVTKILEFVDDLTKDNCNRLYPSHMDAGSDAGGDSGGSCDEDGSTGTSSDDEDDT